MNYVVLPDPSSGVGQKLTQVEVTRLSWWIQWSSPWEGLMRRRLWRGVRIPSNLTPGHHLRYVVDMQRITRQSHLLPKIAAYTASQLASHLHTTQCCRGQNILAHVLNNVTLGISAGACQGGGNRPPETQKRCTHSKGGVCSLHGPGAKWCWKPIPVGKRKPGPSGKLISEE